MDKAVQYVVYRFDKKEKVNLEDPSHIVAITRDTYINCLMKTARQNTTML